MTAMPTTHSSSALLCNKSPLLNCCATTKTSTNHKSHVSPIPLNTDEPKLNSGAWDDDQISIASYGHTTTSTTSTTNNGSSTPVIPLDGGGGTPILSSRNQNRLKVPSSPSLGKRSDPLNSFSVAAAAAASSLRHSFNVANNNNYNLNHQANHQSTTPGLPDKLKGSFKGRGRHAAGLPRSQKSTNGVGDENVNSHGRFQRTLSLDGRSELSAELAAADGHQMPRELPPSSVGVAAKNNGKNKRLMFGSSKFSQNSLSFDMRDSSAHHKQLLHKSHSAEHDSACEEEDEDGVVLRKKIPLEFDEHSDDSDRLSDKQHTGILSNLISTSHRNSQLRSTLSKARHHLSFEKWRSSSSHQHQHQHHNSSSASLVSSTSTTTTTPNSHNHSQECSSANQSNLSNSSSITPPTPSESPGGRLSRWFSIRRGSSHHYDLNGGGGNGGSGGNSGNSRGVGTGGELGGQLGRDVRDGGGGGGSGTSSRLNSINNEHELALQIQQQLHQSLSKVISQQNALQQLQQQSQAVTSNNSSANKMPLVAEGNEEVDGYHTFGRGMSYRTTSTLKSANSINPNQLLTPMPPVPPAGLTQQQLKRRHIVAAIAHSEISYVATLSRLVNVSI